MFMKYLRNHIKIQVIRRIDTFPAVGAVLLRRKISDLCEISGDIFELVSKFEIKLHDLIDLEMFPAWLSNNPD